MALQPYRREKKAPVPSLSRSKDCPYCLDGRTLCTICGGDGRIVQGCRRTGMMWDLKSNLPSYCGICKEQRKCEIKCPDRICFNGKKLCTICGGSGVISKEDKERHETEEEASSSNSQEDLDSGRKVD
jgi:hypothetical protein